MQDNVLPNSLEAEEAVIGTILTYPDSINNVLGILSPDMFYNDVLKSVYQGCIDLIHEGKIVDSITVTKNRIDIVPYLTSLTGRIITDRLIENHALIVKEKYLLRKYILLGNEIITKSIESDLADVADVAETELLRLAGLLSNKEPQKLGDLVDGVITNIDKLVRGEISLIGVPSGFTKIDRITGGFKPGELTIIAGRPSHGKTALALQIAKNTAELSNPVLMFSCEMSEDEQSIRYLAGISGYSNIELSTGRCDIETLLKTSEPLLKLPVFIDDTASLKITEIRAKVRKMILKHGIKIVIIDYLQLLSGSGQNREQEISQLSRGLKCIAKDLNVPIIALSQLNRMAEGRATKEPQLSDLRESGAIEQDADRVLLIYRPKVYKIDSVMINGNERDTTGLIVVNMAKNRNGVTGEFELFHNDSMTVIRD